MHKLISYTHTDVYIFDIMVNGLLQSKSPTQPAHVKFTYGHVHGNTKN